MSIAAAVVRSRKRVKPTCAKTTVDANPDAEKSNTLVRDMMIRIKR